MQRPSSALPVEERRYNFEPHDRGVRPGERHSMAAESILMEASDARRVAIIEKKIPPSTSLRKIPCPPSHAGHAEQMPAWTTWPSSHVTQVVGPQGSSTESAAVRLSRGDGRLPECERVFTVQEIIDVRDERVRDCKDSSSY